MIKILHSADWHLDSPLSLSDETRSRRMRQLLQSIPGRIAAACKAERADLVLLSGDLFDGPYAADTYRQLYAALEDMGVPVFISPGNHDPIGPDSPWLSEQWPENVHIFTHPAIEAVDVPELDCCVYGAGFVAMDCPGLLQDFSPTHTEKYAVGVLHGDPTQVTSPYCPVTVPQVTQSGLDYLALGHIHKAGSFTGGKTLCGWPGCPMGRGYDEEGEKGYYIVTLDGETTLKFVDLGLPRFYDLEVTPEQTPADLLPPVGNEDYYRLTFTGARETPDLAALEIQYSHFPNLLFRDRTTPPLDIWGSAGEDTFEGVYFKLLHDALEQAQGEDAAQIQLAAEISRKLLEGQEVVLP